MSNHIEEYKKVFKAIDSGLVFSDERDEDDFVVLVDENRELDDYTPKKALIKEMEDKGLIEAIEKETEREYMHLDNEKVPVPLISIFTITDKGKALSN